MRNPRGQYYCELCFPVEEPKDSGRFFHGADAYAFHLTVSHFARPRETYEGVRLCYCGARVQFIAMETERTELALHVLHCDAFRQEVKRRQILEMMQR